MLRTNTWGPAFWVIIHSFAKKLDETSSCVDIDFWKEINRLIPCVHCIRSMSTFIKEFLLSSTACQTSNARFVYLLHQYVNCKLIAQDLVKTKGVWPRDLSAYWCGYQPVIGSVRYEYNSSGFSLRYFDSLTLVACFVVYAYPHLLSEVLQLMLLMTSSNEVLPRPVSTTRSTTGVLAVLEMDRYIRSSHGVVPSWGKSYYLQLCQAADTSC
jgi:hypothetical protein